MVVADAEGVLEVVLAEYDALPRLTFDGLFQLEERVTDSHDLMLLYEHILSSAALSAEQQIQTKIFEKGITGYIHGRMLQAIRESAVDPLTGLADRKGFSRGLDRILKRAERQYDPVSQTIAVLFADINGFKDQANDKYGHQFGDEVLRYAGQAIKQCARFTDLVARLSGDEFAVVLDPVPADHAYGVLLRYTADAMKELQGQLTIHHPNKLCAVSFSFGMSLYGVDAQSPEVLLEHADKAAYYAKKQVVIVPDGEFQGQHFHCHQYTPGLQDSYVGKDQRKGRGG